MRLQEKPIKRWLTLVYFVLYLICKEQLCLDGYNR